MENASKALIIAGAILLAILIISLGILIYNQASSVVNENTMDSVEVSQFNTQFTQYEGTKSGSTVRSLAQAVLSSNVSQDDDDRKVSLTVVDGGSNYQIVTTSTDQIDNLEKISTGGTYDIECAYSTTGANSGLVTSITATKK